MVYAVGGAQALGWELFVFRHMIASYSAASAA